MKAFSTLVLLVVAVVASSNCQENEAETTTTTTTTTTAAPVSFKDRIATELNKIHADLQKTIDNTKGLDPLAISYVLDAAKRGQDKIKKIEKNIAALEGKPIKTVVANLIKASGDVTYVVQDADLVKKQYLNVIAQFRGNEAAQEQARQGALLALVAKQTAESGVVEIKKIAFEVLAAGTF